MIEIDVTNNMMSALVEWQKRAVQSFTEAAQLYRAAVQESLGTEAQTAEQHAQPGFPRLKHTGDLQKSIHYIGGVIPITEDIYFEVFMAADYGVDYEPFYPVMEPVFEKAATMIVNIMSSTGDDRRAIFSSASMFALKTQTWFTRSYEHNVNLSYRDIDLERKVQSW